MVKDKSLTNKLIAKNTIIMLQSDGSGILNPAAINRTILCFMPNKDSKFAP
jgi:hypothetical protein